MKIKIGSKVDRETINPNRTRSTKNVKHKDNINCANLGVSKNMKRSPGSTGDSGRISFVFSQVRTSPLERGSIKPNRVGGKKHLREPA